MHHTERTRLTRAIATLAVLAALAVGCGDSGSKDSKSATKAGSTSTSPSSSSSSSASKGATTTTSSAAGGSAPSGTSKGGAAGDFCSKITDKEASAVLGVAITRREPSATTAPGTAACIKGNARQTDLSKGAFVTFGKYPALGPFASFDQAKAKFPDAKVENGVGDKAFYSPSGGLLFAFSGKSVYQAQVYKFGKRGTEAEVIAIAKTLVGRAG